MNFELFKDYIRDELLNETYLDEGELEDSLKKLWKINYKNRVSHSSLDMLSIADAFVKGYKSRDKLRI